jgi:hypothetical protein
VSTFENVTVVFAPPASVSVWVWLNPSIESVMSCVPSMSPTFSISADTSISVPLVTVASAGWMLLTVKFASACTNTLVLAVSFAVVTVAV